jgi:hypothetical protein
MTFEITFGWWLAPLTITLMTFVWHWWMHKDEIDPGSVYGVIGRGLGEALTLLVAAVVSLLAWLIWAVLT